MHSFDFTSQSVEQTVQLGQHIGERLAAGDVICLSGDLGAGKTALTRGIAAGWGGNTDWYRNLLANPQVTVQVGSRKFATLAEPAPDEEVARYMMEVSQRHPRMDRVWNRWSDQPVDGTFESYVHTARFFPSVWLKPITETGEGVK